MAVKSKSTSATTTSLAPNLASALCYVPFIGWVAAIVLFIVEKNETVKWNAVQSLLLSGVLWVAGMVLAFTLILALLSPVLMLAGLVLNLVLAVKSYQGETVKLPLLSDWTDKILKKV